MEGFLLQRNDVCSEIMEEIRQANNIYETARKAVEARDFFHQFKEKHVDTYTIKEAQNAYNYIESIYEGLEYATFRGWPSNLEQGCANQARAEQFKEYCYDTIFRGDKRSDWGQIVIYESSERNTKTTLCNMPDVLHTIKQNENPNIYTEYQTQQVLKALYEQ